MSTDLDTDPTAALLRATFAAAADSLTVDDAPDLPVHDGAVVPLARRRHHPMHWSAAAAVVALLAGAAWVTTSGSDGLPVSTTPSPGVDSRSDDGFHPFAEPSWVPDGLELVVASQSDRPPQYTADVETADGDRATLHWRYGRGSRNAVWNDAEAPGGEYESPERVSFVGNHPVDGFQAWGEPTRNRSTHADAPAFPAASFDTITSLLEQLVVQCSPERCDHFTLVPDGTLLGARVLRQGPDTVDYGPATLTYWGDTGTVRVTTWPITGTIPADGTLPTAGLAEGALIPDQSTARRVEVGTDPAVYVDTGSSHTLVVELADRGVTVAVASGTVGDEDDLDVVLAQPFGAATLSRIAASLEVHSGRQFTDRFRTGLDNTVEAPPLISIDTGSTVFDISAYSRSDVERCRYYAGSRTAEFGQAAMSLDACIDPDEANRGPVRSFGTYLRRGGERGVIGVFDDHVDSIRITTDEGEVVSSQTVVIPDSGASVVLVDVPAGAATAELFDAAGAPVATPVPLGYAADQAWAQ